MVGVGAGARYILVVRDPMDVAVSFFKFFEGWLFEPGEIELDEFVDQFVLQRGALPVEGSHSAPYAKFVVFFVAKASFQSHLHRPLEFRGQYILPALWVYVMSLYICT